MDLTTAAAAGPQQQPQTAAEASNSTASASSSSSMSSSSGSRDSILRFYHACRDGNVAAVQELLREGVSVNAPDATTNLTPLQWAVLTSHASMVQLLLAHGADPHTICSAGHSMLDEAARSGDMEVVKVLLDAGATSRMRLAGCSVPLLSACSSTSPAAPAIVRLLLQHENQHTTAGLRLLLKLALKRPSYDIAAELLRYLEQEQPGSTASMLSSAGDSRGYSPAAASLAMLKGWAGDSGDAAEQAAAAAQERDTAAQSQAVRELLVGLAAGGLDSEGEEDASVEVCSPAASAVDDLGVALGRVAV